MIAQTSYSLTVKQGVAVFHHVMQMITMCGIWSTPRPGVDVLSL